MKRTNKKKATMKIKGSIPGLGVGLLPLGGTASHVYGIFHQEIRL
jgi:hypothetical protein